MEKKKTTKTESSNYRFDYLNQRAASLQNFTLAHITIFFFINSIGLASFYSMWQNFSYTWIGMIGFIMFTANGALFLVWKKEQNNLKGIASELENMVGNPPVSNDSLTGITTLFWEMLSYLTIFFWLALPVIGFAFKDVSSEEFYAEFRYVCIVIIVLILYRLSLQFLKNIKPK